MYMYIYIYTTAEPSAARCQIFVHVKHCVTGQPEVGDLLTFDIEILGSA